MCQMNMLKWKVCHFEGAPIPSLSLVLPPDWRPRLHSGAPCSILVPPGSILVSPGSILKVFLYFFFEFWYIFWIFCLEMFTGILHPMRVQKRLCVSVLGGKQSIYFLRFRKYFICFGVFVKQIVILNSVFGFIVLNSIWEHGLNQGAPPGTFFGSALVALGGTLKHATILH